LETIASGLTVDPALGARVRNFIIGDIHVAAQAAQQQAIREGFDSEILDLQIKGEAREVGLRYAKKLKEEKQKRKSPFCLIAGGETTVTIKGNGKGGRNQELALAAVDELSGMEDILFGSLATDGDDGPTDAAGAAVNGETRQRAERRGMSASDHLSRNDAYMFFDPLNDLIKCGYTGTNVNDLVFLVAF
jgi:hydroxypyruvate reductase